MVSFDAARPERLLPSVDITKHCPARA